MLGSTLPESLCWDEAERGLFILGVSYCNIDKDTYTVAPSPGCGGARRERCLSDGAINIAPSEAT